MTATRTPVAATGRRPRDGTVAFWWGAAEAVVWFVVPDVFLTWVAVRSGLRASPRLVVLAVAGAIVGGVLAYGWGAAAPGTARDAMERLPGVDVAMVEAVGADVEAAGPVALLKGPARGRPYKLYAAAAGEHGESLLLLVLWTIPGRAMRFLLASVGAAWAASIARRRLPESVVRLGWMVVWFGIYVALWT
jgi:membrane protein YqaA with SNARE-associated domain